MSGFVVVDTILAFKWLVRTEHTDKALAILCVWQDEDVTAAAPYLLPFEVSNALYKRATRWELRLDGEVDLIGNLLASQIEFQQPWNLHGKALETASRFGQAAAYDAHYPALAESLGFELCTADEKFYQSVGQEMRQVRWIGAYRVPK